MLRIVTFKLRVNFIFPLFRILVVAFQKNTFKLCTSKLKQETITFLTMGKKHIHQENYRLVAFCKDMSHYEEGLPY